MKSLLACLLLVLASDCAAAASATPACPTLPPDAHARVVSDLGVDSLECDVVSVPAKEPLFSVYVGNHPDVPRDLRYGGTTVSKQRNLVWFFVPDGHVFGKRTWRTFLPTGHRSMSVAMVWFTANGQSEFTQRAELVAQLQLPQ